MRETPEEPETPGTPQVLAVAGGLSRPAPLQARRCWGVRGGSRGGPLGVAVRHGPEVGDLRALGSQGWVLGPAREPGREALDLGRQLRHLLGCRPEGRLGHGRGVEPLGGHRARPGEPVGDALGLALGHGPRELGHGAQRPWCLRVPPGAASLADDPPRLLAASTLCGLHEAVPREGAQVEGAAGDGLAGELGAPCGRRWSVVVEEVEQAEPERVREGADPDRVRGDQLVRLRRRGLVCRRRGRGIWDGCGVGCGIGHGRHASNIKNSCARVL